MQLKTITLEKFLKIYLGIENKVFSNMTHSDIKILMPTLKRCSYEHAYNNCDEILKGEIIIVSDSKGNIVPYLKPNEKIEFQEIHVFASSDAPKEEVKDILDYSELTNYELKRLLNVSKNGYAITKKAKSELKSREVSKSNQKVLKRINNNEYLRNYVED